MNGSRILEQAGRQGKGDCLPICLAEQESASLHLCFSVLSRFQFHSAIFSHSDSALSPLSSNVHIPFHSHLLPSSPFHSIPSSSCGAIDCVVYLHRQSSESSSTSSNSRQEDSESITAARTCNRDAPTAVKLSVASEDSFGSGFVCGSEPGASRRAWPLNHDSPSPQQTPSVLGRRKLGDAGFLGALRYID